MEIHHIFIFTRDGHKVADELVASGFKDGSSRNHPGQGTANRKFYFRNFYLEILWVQDPETFYSTAVSASGLGERYELKGNYSPFGLCLERCEETAPLFAKAFAYRPPYLQEGQKIEVLRNVDQPGLPWTFRLPFQSKPSSEPLYHPNGIRKLTAANFHYKTEGEENSFLRFFQQQENLGFFPAEKNFLRLQFDRRKQGRSFEFEELNLRIDF